MNICILNDTSNYHHGSRQVINFLKNSLKNHNIVCYKKINKNSLDSYDVLVINGEGTMHDNAKKAKTLIDTAVYAKTQRGIKVILVNSVWQRNDDELTRKLQFFDYVGVREILSKQEIRKVINIDVNINLDFSYYPEVAYEKFPNTNIVAGNYYKKDSKKTIKASITNVGEDSRIDIFSEDWSTVVNKLRHARILISGLHHEMYAACKAECPFIVLEGNTHKNSGLFKTLGVNIPVLPFDATTTDINNAIKNIDQYRDEYTKLFQVMKASQAPKLIDLI
jgi:polysaccharide pyruvyl transferase WcaK-like protein